jgi:hypothetical protein
MMHELLQDLVASSEPGQVAAFFILRLVPSTGAGMLRNKVLQIRRCRPGTDD